MLSLCSWKRLCFLIGSGSSSGDEREKGETIKVWAWVVVSVVVGVSRVDNGVVVVMVNIGTDKDPIYGLNRTKPVLLLHIYPKLGLAGLTMGLLLYTDYLCRGVRPPHECPGFDTKQSDDEVTVMLGLWGNAEHPFIAIAPKSTLAWNGSIW